MLQRTEKTSKGAENLPNNENLESGGGPSDSKNQEWLQVIKVTLYFRLDQAACNY